MPVKQEISLEQLKLECSVSAGTNSFPESSVWQQTAPLVSEETQSSVSDSEEEMGGKPASALLPQRGPNASAAAPDDDDGGNESDASVEMMEPCSVVIDIDESDSEDAPDAPVHQEPPQKSVSVEFNSSSSQTFPQNEVER